MSSSSPGQQPPYKFYSLYGKRLKSTLALPLPELPAHKPDITIQTGQKLPKTLDASPVPSGREWIHDPDRSIVRFYDGAGHIYQFDITENAANITVSQTWPVWEDSVFALVNMVMGAVLTLQGHPMFHACSLVHDGRSFLLMGDSGAGKSSLSIALSAEGLRAHADDVVVIDNIRFPASNDRPGIPEPVISGSGPVVAPGYPRIKVKPELIARIGIRGVTPIHIATVEGPEGERWIDTDQLPGGTHRNSAAIGAIFLLGKRVEGAGQPVVRRLSPMQAAFALSGHMYGTAWFNPPGPKNLFMSTYTAEKVPVYEVSLPDDLDVIRESARYLIRNYIENLPVY